MIGRFSQGSAFRASPATDFVEALSQSQLVQLVDGQVGEQVDPALENRQGL
jgi:hypothetical protein